MDQIIYTQFIEWSIKLHSSITASPDSLSPLLLKSVIIFNLGRCLKEIKRKTSSFMLHFQYCSYSDEDADHV